MPRPWGLTLHDGKPVSGSTKSTVASVPRRLFAWAREERIVTTNPALELRAGWGGSLRRKVIIPSIPQVLRLAAALDHFKPGLGDVAMVLAFTGLRWEEAVAVLIESVDLADLAIGRMRTAGKLTDLSMALAGRFTEHHALLCRLHRDRITSFGAAIADLDERIARPHAGSARQTCLRPFPGSGTW